MSQMPAFTLAIAHGFCQSFQCFTGFIFILLRLMVIEFLLCLAITLFLNAITCFPVEYKIVFDYLSNGTT